MTMHLLSARALRLALLVPLSLAVSPATAWAASPIVKVMTYNTHHGGWATTPSTTDRQLDTIAAQDPDVVVLQEAYASQLSYYVDGLNCRLGTDTWQGTSARTCKAGSEPVCNRYSSESVMILTRLTTLAVNARLVAEQKTAGIKTTLVRLPFDATAHQFLRIRRVDNETSGASDVTFETAPGAADGPGPFTERHRAPWDAAIDATALRLELKAGTSRPETSPGSISWDNLRAATNCR